MHDGRARAAAALLVLAFGIGAGAPAVRTHDRVYALVAARDLNPGVPISADDLVAVAIDPELLPNGVMIAPEQVIGRRLHERVLANELVRAERIADIDAGTGLNGTLPDGMRAITVEVVDDNLMSWLAPGMVVDVLVTLPGATPWRQGTWTLAQGVSVLAVHRLAAPTDALADTEPQPDLAWVTLQVTERQAEPLAAPEPTWSLRLTLLNQQNNRYVEDFPVPLPMPANSIAPVRSEVSARTGSPPPGMALLCGDGLVRPTPKPPRTAPGVRTR